MRVYTGKKYEIDLILMDITMPVTGRLKCLQEILHSDTTAKLVIARGKLALFHIGV